MQLATVTDSHLATLRNQTLIAAAGVPGVTDWLANKLSQLDIGYPHPTDALAGRRVDPRISQPHGLSWTFVVPDGSPVPDLPSDFTTTTSARVGRPIAVRPDGIAADRALVSGLFGQDALERMPA